MTRRDFILTPAAPMIRVSTSTRLPVPVHRVVDGRAQWAPEQLQRFWWSIWPEAVRDFGRGGIELRTSDGPGEMRRSPGDRPVFVGLRRCVINLVVTDHIPIVWDKGRALAGLTTIHEGYHVCLVALRYAHGHQIPFLSVNTCVHELLHALLQDVYLSKPGRLEGSERELRTDWCATRLWLFRDGAEVRKSAEGYLERLRAEIR